MSYAWVQRTETTWAHKIDQHVNELMPSPFWDMGYYKTSWANIRELWQLRHQVNCFWNEHATCHKASD